LTATSILQKVYKILFKELEGEKIKVKDIIQYQNYSKFTYYESIISN